MSREAIEPAARAVDGAVGADGQVDERLETLAATVDRVLGPEQDPEDPLREVLASSRDAQVSWVADREPVAHVDAYDFDLWMRWLRETYASVAKRVPADATTVPAVLAELWALWQMHTLAVEDGADPRALHDWHAALEQALRRIGEDWVPTARKQQLEDL